MASPLALLPLCSTLLLLLFSTAPGAAASWVKWKQHTSPASRREMIDITQPLNWESTAKGTIDLEGKPFHIKGINWCVWV
jgi:hypothetical protein